jgi:perosamine synthetase
VADRGRVEGDGSEREGGRLTGAFLPYGRQQIDDEDVAAVAEALRDELITQGPRIDRFEAALADYLGARHVVAFANGTAALHGAAFAAGAGPGDEVVTSPLSFAASANCALYVGAKPRFADISSGTWNLDGAAALDLIGERTRAVVAVSFAGLPVDLNPLRPVRDRVVVIEDAAHALGAVRAGTNVGGPGGADMTVFSFHPVKAITTGEGGAVATDDAEFARRLRLFRTHGITKEGVDPSPAEGEWYYEMQALGFNYRITDIQCALGLSQLRHLDRWIERRNAVAARYRELLADEPRIALPPAAGAGSLHAYHLFVVRVLAGAEARLAVFRALRSASIGVQVHYIPIYRQPYYRDTLGYPQHDCPVAEEYYWGAISLPMYPGMSDSDVERVVSELRAALP